MTTRRQFLGLVGASSAALILGVRLEAESDAEALSSFDPNAWVSIHQDGTVLVRIGKSEMGQGVRTSLPMILAEELDVALDSVTIEQASPGPEFSRLGTGGSGSIMRLWDPLREAGAAARFMLVTAAASRWNVPVDTCTTRRGEVVHEETGRRLAYGRLITDAVKVPVPEKPPLKSREDFELIGRSRSRIDGPDIVTGRAVYGLDVRVPGMRYAVVARPPSFGQTIRSLDSRKAKKRAGVLHVLEIPSGVAVIATNTWSALQGREALEIEWKAGEGSAFDSDLHAQTLREAALEPGITIRKDGAGAAALDQSPRKLDALYEYGYQAHAPVEPVNCTALYDGDHCTIWSPTQTPNSVQAVAAHVLELDPSQIDVNVMLIGGGFGRRLGHDFDREAIEIAKQMKGIPVQLVWSREDDMQHGYFQAASAHYMSAGISEAGTVDVWIHRKASSPHNARGTASADEKKNPGIVRGWAWGVYDNPYAIPSMEMSYRVVDAPVPIGPWRAVFSPPSVFARESFVDEIAIELDRDPLDLRLELLGRDDDSIPHTFTIDRSTTDRRRLRHLLETVAERAGWGATPATGTGRGLACNVFHTGTYVAYIVDVTLRKDPPPGALPFVVERVFCAIDCGVAVNPRGIEQQVESGIIWSLSNMKSEITFRDGRARESTYADFPVVMIDETPRSIDVAIIDSDDERPHGIGEPTVCPFAPAVANALSRLTGTRLRRPGAQAARLRRGAGPAPRTPYQQNT